MSKLAVTIDADTLKKDVDINDVDLTSAMMNQPGLFAYYAQKCAEAQRQMDRAKITVELTESKTHDKLTRALIADGKKPVETALTKAIMRDPDVLRAKMRYTDTKMVYAIAKEALEALKQRRDMLVQIGVNAREEMKGEMRIQAIEANTNAAEAQRSSARSVIGKGRKDAA